MHGYDIEAGAPGPCGQAVAALEWGSVAMVYSLSCGVAVAALEWGSGGDGFTH